MKGGIMTAGSRIHFPDPYVPNRERWGTITSGGREMYINWDDDLRWDYLEDWLRAADANGWQYEVKSY